MSAVHQVRDQSVPDTRTPLSPDIVRAVIDAYAEVGLPTKFMENVLSSETPLFQEDDNNLRGTAGARLFPLELTSHMNLPADEGVLMDTLPHEAAHLAQAEAATSLDPEYAGVQFSQGLSLQSSLQTIGTGTTRGVHELVAVYVERKLSLTKNYVTETKRALAELKSGEIDYQEFQRVTGSMADAFAKKMALDAIEYPELGLKGLTPEAAAWANEHLLEGAVADDLQSFPAIEEALDEAADIDTYRRRSE